MSIETNNHLPGSVFVSGPPRCGTHWLTYIVSELLPNSRVKHCHTVRDSDRFDMLVLILRNPKEACLRHAGSGTNRGFGHKFNDDIDIPARFRSNSKEFKEDLYKRRLDSIFTRNFNGEPYVNDYIYPIKFFDSFQGKKFLVYYEDLIIDKDKIIQDIGNFIGVSVTDFLSNYVYHKEKSIEKYQERFPSVTKGEKVVHHSLLFDKSIIDRFDEVILKQEENILSYINRYRGV